LSGLEMKRIQTVLTLLAVMLLSVSAALAGGMPDFKTRITAEDVMVHVRALAVDIGARPAGSDAEAEAAEYIATAFESWGYAVEIQEFEIYTDSGISRNVIATRAGDEQIIVVGAHMDSVTAATGAGDNASGVAALLGAAEALAEIETVHTLVFVAFGAEEVGLVGSRAFVEQMDIEHVIAMINLDSVGVGSQLNVYAGALVTGSADDHHTPNFTGGPTWVRDTALDLAAEMGLPFGTTPDETWGGYIGDWSDHYPFVEAGVPIAYFEAWGWVGDAANPWWGIETPQGQVIDTEKDVYEAVVPDKVEMTAELVAATVYVIATGAVGRSSSPGNESLAMVRKGHQWPKSILSRSLSHTGGDK
jgi:acetylornithine deacetylase/succinyl-diaminopimelate desuccinylase-like protein